MSDRPEAGSEHQQGARTPAPLARLGMQVNPVVFFLSTALIFAFVVAGSAFSAAAEATFEAIEAAVSNTLSWWYVALVTGLLVFVLYVAFSRHGHVRLGRDDQRPDFSLVAWFTMLFSAGMGIGLLYNGVAQPLTFVTDPPSAEPGTVEAASEAMNFVFYHWGLHPWAIYSTVGLAVAYFAFRRELPVSFRSAFYGLLGDRVNGRAGDALDIFAVFGTMFGVAASLGLGARQINAGLSEVFGIPFSVLWQIIVIAVITAVATVSVVLGLDRGIKRLSEFNIGLSGALLLFVFVTGPTVFLLDSFIENIGSYLQSLTQIAFYTDSFDMAEHIQVDWTMALWGWWIAWAPFVGIFIARISRGRTVREFILGAMLVPTLVSFFWFTVLGESAIVRELAGNGLAEVLEAEEGDALVFFAFLEGLPLATVTSVVAVVAVFIFFVTSSDSGSLVIDMMTSGGHPDPPKVQRVFWAVTEGVVTTVLLLAGGIDAIFTSAMAVAVPLTIILVLMAWSFIRGVRQERLPGGSAPVRPERAAVATPDGDPDGNPEATAAPEGADTSMAPERSPGDG